MEEYGLQACVSIPGHYLINFRKAILEQVEDKERVIDRDGFRPMSGLWSVMTRTRCCGGVALMVATPGSFPRAA